MATESSRFFNAKIEGRAGSFDYMQLEESHAEDEPAGLRGKKTEIGGT
jgi:hypothetical protein